MMAKLQQRSESSRFQRACAVLCLFLLLFSVGHTVLGHSDVLRPAQGIGAHHELQSLTSDTPDTCALCVAMTTIVVLAVLAFAAPELAQTRPPLRLTLASPVTEWHPSLLSRPPPAL